MLQREEALFLERNPNSKALAGACAPHWLKGVPMHWMVDWGTPFPLFVKEARGIDVIDVDGNAYKDFCLGDTGAMFGHSPAPVAEAIARQARHGLTTMMPSPDAAAVGGLLAERFGLPVWQVTATASDANRAVIRWARAATGRKAILVFNGCYHGAVDETFITVKDGRTVADPSLVGEPRDLAQFARVVEFNDVAALKAALADHQVACVLAEPVMTNIGMVLPAAGYLKSLREATRATGTLLVIDETHTMSSGPGGYTRAHGLEPDAIVMGKPIAGGIPAAVYGLTQEFADRIRAALKDRPPGHSGIGTTLSGSAIQLAAMRAVLEHYMTGEAFAPLIELARRLERGIADVIIKHGVGWTVARVGARVEFICSPHPPKNGGEAAKVIHRPIDVAVHQYLLNRGLIVTPFHNMMLISPSTTADDVDRFIATLDQCIEELKRR